MQIVSMLICYVLCLTPFYLSFVVFYRMEGDGRIPVTRGSGRRRDRPRTDVGDAEVDQAAG